jgi:hypothetical protein
MYKRVVYVLATAGVASFVGLLFLWMYTRPPDADALWAAYAKHPEGTAVKIVYPREGTVFPPEIAAPTFRWEDGNAAASTWLIRVELGGGRAPLSSWSHECRWVPAAQDWELIKKCSRDTEARVFVLGIQPGRPARVVSAATITLRTSRDEV